MGVVSDFMDGAREVAGGIRDVRTISDTIGDEPPLAPQVQPWQVKDGGFGVSPVLIGGAIILLMALLWIKKR